MTGDDTQLARERLMKLWDGYETQEKELKQMRAKIADLETKSADKDRIIETLRELIENKDTDLRKLEIANSSLKNENDDLKNRVEDLSVSLESERKRYRKLFVISEGLERDNDQLRRSIEERDNWFRDNLSFLEEIPGHLAKREEMIRRGKGRSSLLESLETPSEREALPKESEEKPTFERVDEEDEFKELMEIPGIDEEKADTLRKGGFGSLDRIKEASPFDLVKLDGITPTLARKITEYVKE